MTLSESAEAIPWKLLGIINACDVGLMPVFCLAGSLNPDMSSDVANFW